MIARQDAETAAIDRERFVQPELGAKIRDGLIAKVGEGCVEPGDLGFAIGVERGEYGVVVFQILGVDARGLQFFRADLAQKSNGTVIDLSPNRGVNVLEDFAPQRIPTPPQIVRQLPEPREARRQRGDLVRSALNIFRERAGGLQRAFFVGDGVLIEPNVALGGRRPREILRHRALLQSPPDLRHLIGLHRAHNRREHRPAVVRAKNKARAAILARLEILDRIGEATRCADDGQAAVAHRDHLVGPARLAVRGHQKHIAARVDLARKLLVKREKDRHAVGKLLAEPGEEIVIVLIASAHQDELHVECIEQVVNRLADEVNPFLIVEPRDHRDDGRFGARGQPRFLLKRELVSCAQIQ